MIVEQRTYTLGIGKVPEFYQAYEELGMATQTEILGNMVGYFHTEFGPLNQIVHMWGYDNFEDRTRRRAAMQADPRWQAYLAESRRRGFVQDQHSTILIPAPFSPIR